MVTVLKTARGDHRTVRVSSWREGLGLPGQAARRTSPRFGKGRLFYGAQGLGERSRRQNTHSLYWPNSSVQCCSVRSCAKCSGKLVAMYQVAQLHLESLHLCPPWRPHRLTTMSAGVREQSLFPLSGLDSEWGWLSFAPDGVGTGF